MLSVAVTGNAASGKSEVARAWAAAGVPVVSADDLSRAAVDPDTAAGRAGLAEVRRAFGDGVLDAAGGLDRARVRDLVFRDDDARRRLEAILHPRIAALRESWVRERSAEGHALVVSEIPLLYEAGLADRFDVVVFVDAPEATRLERLVARRGLAEGEARRLMAAQMDPALKRDRADHVLANDGSLEELRARSLALLERLRARAGADGDAATAPGDGLLRIDLHMHTWGSWDCLSDPEAILAAARARGVERIALTDHDRLDVALDAAARWPDRVIPAEEVRTAEGIDVIGLYLSEAIPRGTPARETCDLVHAQGGLVYLPHPYAGGKGGGGRHAEALAPHVDVVEVFNGRLHDPRQNDAAAALAERHGRLRGAGSDAHTVAEVARSWVELPWHPNRPEALREALGAGRVHGTTAPRRVHLASTWAKLRHRLPGAPGPRRA